MNPETIEETPPNKDKKDRLYDLIRYLINEMGKDQDVEVRYLVENLVVIRNFKQYFDLLEKENIPYKKSDKLKLVVLNTFSPAATIKHDYAIILLPRGENHSLKTLVHEIQHLIDMHSEAIEIKDDYENEYNFLVSLILLTYIQMPIFFLKDLIGNFQDEISLAFYSTTIAAAIYGVHFLKNKWANHPMEVSAKKAEKKYSSNNEFVNAWKKMKGKTTPTDSQSA